MAPIQKFSKADLTRISDLRGTLREKADEIETAFEPLAELISNINSLIAEYNEIITEANGVIEDIAREVQDGIDDMSEKWQEGDKGSAIIEWQSELESFSLETVDDVEVPEGLTLDHDGQLENIPEQANV
jgi:hypothetical protein